MGSASGWVELQRPDGAGWRLRLLGLLGVVVLYLLLAVVLYRAGVPGAAMLMVLPVAAAGWLFGVRAGLLTGVLALPLSIPFFALLAAPVADLVRERALVGTLLLMTFGGTAGWLRNLLATLRQQSRQLAQERALLADEIAERQRAELELRRFASIVESSHDAIIDLALDGAILSWNRAAEWLYGYTAEERIGQSSAAVFGADQPDELQQVFEQVKSGGRAELLETVHLHKDGRRMHVALTLSPVKERLGSISGMSAIVRDISRRKEMEQALQLRERQLAEAHKLARLGGWEYDMASGRLSSSDELRELLGYLQEPAPASGEDFLRIIHAEDLPRIQQAFAQGLRDQRPISCELRLTRRDGTLRAMHVRGEVVLGPAGLATRISGTIQDISDRKETEQALQEAKADAERANQAKSAFLSRMSHELRTPLNAILGFAQLLDMDELQPDQREGVGHILKGGRYLLNLINEVLDITRIETGAVNLSIEPIDLRWLLAEAVDLIRPLLRQQQLTLELAGVEAGLPLALADQQRLKQVLLNLLSNAVKYNRQAGRIMVSCSLAGAGRVRVSVQDTGIGIAQADLQRLFIPFDRLGAEASAVEGSGLGLALSKLLVETMGGTLGVQSSAGAGSTFWIELPGQPAASTQVVQTLPQPGQQRSLPAGAAVQTLLLIEDNLTNLQLIEHILHKWPGYRVIPAMQGRLGLELARKHAPDLILLDLHLPDLHGSLVLEQLRADPTTSNIPVLVVSADATSGQRERLLSAGAAAYLTKPLDIRAFMRLIDELRQTWTLAGRQGAAAARLSRPRAAPHSS